MIDIYTSIQFVFLNSHVLPALPSTWPDILGLRLIKDILVVEGVRAP